MSKVKPVHVGVIGAGMISGSYLNAMTSKFEIIQVDAIADINMKAAESAAEKYGIKACTVEELLAMEELEMVVNLTPPAAHEEVITKILESGKHAFTEKCYMLDTASAARVGKLADEKGLYVGTAPDTFFSGWQQTARNFIDSGKLGKVTSFAMVGNRDYDLLMSIMAYLRKPGGGVIQDYSVYYLTALVNLLGPVAKVNCYIKTPFPTRTNISERSPQFGETIESDNESQFYSVIELESGVTGTMSINADSALYDQTYFAIYGTKGILYLGCPDWFNGEVRFYENHYDFSKAAFPVRELVEIPYGFNVDSRGVGAADMAWAIREGRDARASKERAYHVLDIQECMFKSHELNGAFVEVPSTCERSIPLSVPTDGEESSLKTKNLEVE